MYYKTWDGITYTFLNFNGAIFEILECMGNFIAHFTGHMPAYPYWDDYI